MGRRNLIAVWTAIAVLLVTSVVAYAVTADDGSPTAVRMGDSSDPSDAAEGPYGEVVPSPGLDVPTAPAITMPTPTTIDGRLEMPESVVIEPVPPVTLPTAPKLQPKPMPAPPAPAPAPRPDLNGADCGTPWGYGGYGAEASRPVGTANLKVQVYHCHSYDGDPLQNFVEWHDANSVAVDVDMDYGDGTSADGRSGGWACSDPKVGKPWHHSGPPHFYANAGQYRVTATVTYQPCEAGEPVGEPRTAIIGITAFRHAGKRPG